MAKRERVTTFGAFRRLLDLAPLLVLAAATIASSAEAANSMSTRDGRAHRFLSDSEDESEDGDDDYWAFDDHSILWNDYSIMPKKCINFNKKQVIVYDLFGKGHNGCQKKNQGSYYMDVGEFAKAYSKQKEVDYELKGYDYDEPEALDYLDCTAVEYNDVYYYVQLGCSTAGGLRIATFSDEYCTTEVNIGVGVYNDIKIVFDACQTCVAWPSQNNNDDGDDDGGQDLDDNFEYYHQYDSKLCSAASYYKTKCNRRCRRMARSSSSSSSKKSGWTGIEKFFLICWFATLVGLIWVVLKQRRLMSRESALAEEAAMVGIGLKKRHIFPIALAIIFFILLFMFLVKKKLTWLLLIGTNAGLFFHWIIIRRRARKDERASGYHADGGLQIS